MSVPPNLDSDNWEAGTIYYRRFNTYLIGYAVSLVALIGLVVWYGRYADVSLK